MDQAYIAIIVLIAVVCFQTWFYLKQIHRLIDKVMAGNYATYTQAQAFVNESMKAPVMPNGFNVQLPQQEDDELAQLNAMIKPPL